MTDPVKLPGAEKAAVLLMTLGESAAAEVLKHLSPKEVQKIGVAMAGMQKISKGAVKSAVAAFIEDVRNETSLGVGADEYIRSVLTSALGEEKAGSMIDRILLGGNTKGLESLKWMDARGVVELIRYEHPQILAIVLSYLDGDHAAEVLSEFPEKVRADILMRIATLDGVQPVAMQELNEILEKQLRGGSGLQSSTIGGVKAAANILNFVDSNVGTSLMEQVKQVDVDLSQRIEDLMFVFDNLIDVDDRGIQTLLREISSENLVLALKGADEEVRAKIFKNMSQRAAEMLREDLESRGPVKLSDVEAAQKEILVVARRLADEGQIVLGGAGGEAMV
jgi:flagellar motor switch protein FliG